MKEIKIFGVKYFADGTKEETFIPQLENSDTWKLPVKNYDAFLFTDENENHFELSFGNRPRRKRNIENVNN